MNKDITLEDLGFNLIHKDKNIIVYQRDFKNNDGVYSQILIFNLYDKNLEIENIRTIILSLFDAIVNKYKELGWLDE